MPDSKIILPTPADIYASRYALTDPCSVVETFMRVSCPQRLYVEPWEGEEPIPGAHRFQCRNHMDYGDGYRGIWVYSLWYQKPRERSLRPFMVCAEAGRSGKDAQMQAITDAERYGEAVGFLSTLYLHECHKDDRLWSPTAPLTEFERFYGHTLELGDFPKGGEVSHKELRRIS